MTVQELLAKQSINFAPQGQDFVVPCLNPEHDDKNPSMRIDQITGVFNCFACGYKGNIFYRFGEKVSQLGIRRDLLKKKIRQKRAETVGLSFPSNSIPYIGNWRNIRPETYKKFEAFQNSEKDFVGRIVFPIRDISGNIVAFQGRHTSNGDPKYKFVPAGARLPLYPEVNAREGKIILVEGVYDVLNLYDKGLRNAVCCFGTQNLNEAKLTLVKMQGVEQVDIFMDGDDAGQKAAEEIKILCEKVGLTTRNVHLKGTDPGALNENQVRSLEKKLYA
jgi:DNA primase